MRDDAPPKIGIDQLARDARALAADIVSSLPKLIIESGNLPATAAELRKILAERSVGLFDRGILVRIIQSSDGELPILQPLTTHGVINAAHEVCSPGKFDKDANFIALTLPGQVASLYLDLRGRWLLPPLDGITTAPILNNDGSLFAHEGYNHQHRLWCVRPPQPALPETPSREEAEAALHILRATFRTFPFADASRQHDADLGVAVVDLSRPPAADESAMLCALMTAIVRPSIPLAPAFLVTAPEISGSGTGKGLLVRAICTIAFGASPRAFTAGSERHELDKRFAAELIEAAPALFLDNVNGTSLRSDLLASVITERPCRVRILGKTEMVPLNSAAFIALTGNGLSVSQDLARRFLICRFDAQTEDPESRPFRVDLVKEAGDRRTELLAAALTIWRWGRQNEGDLERGQAIGSFGTWARWVRDPLLTLGCVDPVLRNAEVKAADPARQRLVELFSTWARLHDRTPVTAAELADEVREIADPQARGRQFLAAFLARLVGTRVGGFVLTAERGGLWSATTYALHRTSDAPDHRGHRVQEAVSPSMPPMPPMNGASARDWDAGLADLERRCGSTWMEGND